MPDTAHNPTDDVDLGLARTADRLAATHHPHPDDARRCADPSCHLAWPCVSSRFAERARDAATAAWPTAWTTRHDLAAAGIAVSP
ncbi:hypothetical protein [Longispora albida]|uniref:hypothetical protein n=1 Tax=Longispora albida TaxID=203523 RepID=UPI00036878CF|nr:hypothetical protein [Longispora albida]